MGNGVWKNRASGKGVGWYFLLPSPHPFVCLKMPWLVHFLLFICIRKEWGSGGAEEWGSGGVGERRSGGAEEWGSGGAGEAES